SASSASRCSRTVATVSRSARASSPAGVGPRRLRSSRRRRREGAPARARGGVRGTAASCPGKGPLVNKDGLCHCYSMPAPPGPRPLPQSAPAASPPPFGVVAEHFGAALAWLGVGAVLLVRAVPHLARGNVLDPAVLAATH